MISIFLWGGKKFLEACDDQNQHSADAAIVLAGADQEDRARLLAGIRLVAEGRVRYLILPLRPKGISIGWLLKYYKIKLNVDRRRIILGSRRLSNKGHSRAQGGTYQEALSAIDIMQNKGFRSAIIVTSAYHMRRARLAFERASRGKNMVFYCECVGTGGQDTPLVWWMSPHTLANIIREYLKLAAAFVMYGNSPTGG